MGTLLKYEFRRSRTIFLGIIGVTLLVELVYLVGFFTKVQALFTVGLIGGILCLALGAVAILLYGVIMFNDDIFQKARLPALFHATQCRTDRGCKAFDDAVCAGWNHNLVFTFDCARRIPGASAKRDLSRCPAVYV